MKKALVLAIVCAVGLGVAAVAAPLYGSWDTSVCFTVQTAGAVYISSMSSTIGLGYTVGGWDFAMYMVLDEGGLTDLYFLTDGSLGAFSFYSYLGFDPVGIAFTQWDNAGAISLAGISAYGLFSLENINGFIGSGWTAGGYGSAGDVYVHGEVQFNLAPTIALIDAYGWDGFLAKNTAKSGAWISILQTDCCVCFTGFDLYVYFLPRPQDDARVRLRDGV
jgi:hypothetical protein